MATKKYYRVDRREVAENEELSPEGDYQSGFDNIGKQAEVILEKIWAAEFPNKPQRAGSLFVTDDQACAENYWRTHDKRYLYEVEIDEDAILHRADMHMVDAIGDELKKAIPNTPGYAKCDELARKYWRSERTGDPCAEYLLEKVTGRKRLKDLSDMRAHVRSHVPQHDWTYDVNDDELPPFVQPKPKDQSS